MSLSVKCKEHVTTPVQEPEREKPLSLPPVLSNVDDLLGRTASLHPQRCLIQDGQKVLTYEGFHRSVTAMASVFLDLGIRQKESILICAGGDSLSLITIIGAIRAGLRVILAPPTLKAVELTHVAQRLGVVALVGQAHYDGLKPVETLMTAAIGAARVRLVCSLGPTLVDGAVRLDFDLLNRVPSSLFLQMSSLSSESFPPLITLESTGQPVLHTHANLIMGALNFVTRAGLDSRRPLFNLFAPTHLLGMVSGILSSLLSGARLLLLGSFHSERFLAFLDQEAPVQLVVPMVLKPLFEKAQLLRSDKISSLILVNRYATAEQALTSCFKREEKNILHLNPLHSSEREVAYVDLHVLGERVLIPEPRKKAHVPEPIAALPHYVHPHPSSPLVAFEWLPGAPTKFRGAAVGTWI